MSRWPTLVPGFPDEFRSGETTRFTRYDGTKWVVDEELGLEQATWWVDTVHERTKLYPAELIDVLSGRLPHFAHAEIYGVDPVVGSFRVGLIGMDGLTFASMSGHTLFLDERPERLNIDLAGTEKDYRRQGYAAQLLSNTFDLAMRFEIRLISLKAQLEDGPFVWPLFGFVPTPEEWETLKPHIKAMLRLIEDRLPPDDVRYAEEALDSRNPERIRDIVRMGTPVVSTRTAQPGEPEAVVSAGYVLLAESGVEWYGVLDLDDDPSWALFEDRIRKAMR